MASTSDDSFKTAQGVQASTSVSDSVETTPLLPKSIANSTVSKSSNSPTSKVLGASHGGSTKISTSPTANTRPSYPQGYRVPTSRLGPQRTSYTTQKLKLLPDEPFPEDEESGREVYSQVTRIKDTLARKDAERLGKAHRAVLPRVTSYCTASSYRMKDLARYLSGRKGHKAAPKQFDECLYTPYTYKRLGSPPTRPTTSVTDGGASSTSGLMRLDDEGGEIDVEMTGRSDVFLFEYGVVVFWGFTEEEEKRFLKEIAKFEKEKLADEDIQVEEFNYYITQSYQPRVSIQCKRPAHLT